MEELNVKFEILGRFTDAKQEFENGHTESALQLIKDACELLFRYMPDTNISFAEILRITRKNAKSWLL